MKRGRTGFAVALAVALFSALALASSAGASYVHPSVTGEFGSDGTPSTNFSNVNTVVYQQATDKLYAFDIGSSKVYGFSHPAPSTFTGLPGFPFTYAGGFQDSDISVDNSAGSTAGNLYLTPDSSIINGFTPAGSSIPTAYNGEGEICGVAVDNMGNIWGGRYSGASAIKFTPGNPSIASSFSVADGSGQPCKIAVDQSNNDVYSSGYGQAKVAQYTASGTLIRIYDAPSSNARVAINATRHVAYIGSPNSPKMFAYDTTDGHLLETIEPGGGIRGVAVDEATDTLFVSVSGSPKLKIMPGVLAPTSTTGEPIGNTTVSGTADPDGAGPITQCFFEYKLATESEYPAANKKNCDQPLPYGSSTSVSTTISGLAGETEYKYRLVTANATPGAVSRGAEKSLTPHNVKGLKTEDATAITRTTAELHASFEGDGTPTTYYFEWGTEAEAPFAHKSPIQNAGSPTSPPLADLYLAIDNLVPQTVYRYRVAAENTTGFSPGKVLSFETLPAVPELKTGVADEITQESFTLHGEFDGNGEDTHYYFEYGPTTAYGEKFPVPEADAGAPTGPTTLSYVITEFTGYTTYHYRIVAKNDVGETFGEDMGVTTLPAPLPELAGVSVTDVGATEATIGATVTPNHWDTVYRIQYGTDINYGSKTLSSKSIGHGATPQAISERLTELTPGTTYHYRVQATNFTGTTYGPDLTFTTHSVPGVTAAAARATGTTTAHLSAEAVPNGVPTQVQFRFGPTAGYGNETSPASIGEGFISREAAADLTGLTPGTTYHVQVVATNALGSTTSSDLTLTTDPAAVPLEEATPQPKRCKKGFVRKNGKCVKKHKKQHRKHHKSGAKA